MYQDLLIRIKNAQASRKEVIQAPFSEMDFAIAKILTKTGFIRAVEKRIQLRKPVLELQLAYRGTRGAVNGFKILSVPSRRLYAGYRELRTVRQGYGITLLSTPKGILTGSEARQQKLGGEKLFELW